MSALIDRSLLQTGERLQVSEGVANIVYYRAGDERQPLAVFLPGGGHVARVAYGHEEASRRDFIDAWLQEQGLGLLAISYPSDHPAFETRCSKLSIVQWARSVAALIFEHLRSTPSREFFVIGWSGAGRSVVAVERALKARGLTQICFVSLAATAPFPNLFPAPTPQERLTPEGFWDSSSRHRQWLHQLERQIRADGRPVLDADTYLASYVVNSPFYLRGQTFDTVEASLQLAEEIGAFAYTDYPMVAAIIPEDVEDRLHASSDQSLWGALNVLRVSRDPRASADVVAKNWAAWRDLTNSLPQRLSRTIRGAHFFFMGEPGARTTVRHILDLTNEARLLRRELQTLTSSR
jgi:hypothetical protein